MFGIGKDRVGIVTATAGTGKTELFEADQAGENVTWVDGCSFQVQTPVEVQNVETTTVMEYAECFMPSADGNVTAIDGTVVAFTSIASSKALRQAVTGRDYVMRGDAVFEGPPVPHVFIRCERQAG